MPLSENAIPPTPSNDILLSVRDLKTVFESSSNPFRVIDGVSFSIRAGETFALLGESGCGKSMTALSIMRLLPAPGKITAGSITFAGEALLGLSEKSMRKIRGKRIAMIFQEPMTALNPVLSIGYQINETLQEHTLLNAKARRARSIELLQRVGVPAPEQRYTEYPHQLSGGLKQRIVIAMALACEPDLIIADEPTTALDVTIQAQVLLQLKTRQAETGLAILLITHDLGIVAQMADNIAVMYAGQIVEQADKAAFFAHPTHPYSQNLFRALPDPSKRAYPLDTLPGQVPALNQRFEGCRFAPRCAFVQPLCHTQRPDWSSPQHAHQGQHQVRCHRAHEPLAHTHSPTPYALTTIPDEPLLQVTALQVHFPIRRGLLKKTVQHVSAVDGVDLSIAAGKTVALVGESGCGKTTVGKAILQLIRPTNGQVLFQGQALQALSQRALKPLRSALQIIFQDPFSALNPKQTIGDTLLEGMQAQHIGTSAADRWQRMQVLMQKVGLPEDTPKRYPHEFSGGQRQRIGIARALSVEPTLIVCDEPTSALDVSIQAQILNLLKSLQIELGLAYLFITHNLSVVAYLADDVAVMYLGRIVEYGSVQQILDTPQHPYTQALLKAVPSIQHPQLDESLILPGDVPSPIDPPTGCYFHPRCPLADDICRRTYPQLRPLAHQHRVSCHHVLQP